VHILFISYMYSMVNSASDSSRSKALRRRRAHPARRPRPSPARRRRPAGHPAPAGLDREHPSAPTKYHIGFVHNDVRHEYSVNTAPRGVAQEELWAGAAGARRRRLFDAIAHTADLSITHVGPTGCGGTSPVGSARLVLEVLLWLVGRHSEQGVMLHVCKMVLRHRFFRMTWLEVGARRALRAVGGAWRDSATMC